MLLELIGLRAVVQPTAPVPSWRELTFGRRSALRAVAAAAVLVVMLGAGYAIGRRAVPPSPLESSAVAPPATRVVDAVPFTPPGGVR
jgi:hypothetical protein